MNVKAVFFLMLSLILSSPTFAKKVSGKGKITKKIKYLDDSQRKIELANRKLREEKKRTENFEKNCFTLSKTIKESTGILVPTDIALTILKLSEDLSVPSRKEIELKDLLLSRNQEVVIL